MLVAEKQCGGRPAHASASTYICQRVTCRAFPPWLWRQEKYKRLTETRRRHPHATVRSAKHVGRLAYRRSTGWGRSSPTPKHRCVPSGNTARLPQLCSIHDGTVPGNTTQKKAVRWANTEKGTNTPIERGSKKTVLVLSELLLRNPPDTKATSAVTTTTHRPAALPRRRS